MPNTQTGRFARILPLAFLPALFGLLLVCVIPMERAADALTYPYQMDPEEGFLLGDALALSRGESIYAPIDEPPYIVGNYGPVYPAMYAALLWITGPSLMPGRLLVLLSALVVVAAIAMIVARARVHPLNVALAAVLFASSWDVSEWLPFARVDFPAMAFGLGGMAALVWTRKGGWAVAGVLFALSVLTKQTMLAAPAAALAALLWQRQWREGALMTATALVAWGSVTLAFQAATGGEYLRHTVLYNANVFHWGDLWIWWNHLLMYGMWKMLAAIVGLFVLLLACLFPANDAEKVSLDAATRLVAPMCIAYLAFATLSALGIAKIGSAPNYLLELQAAMALVIALGIGRQMRHAWMTKGSGIAMVLLVSLHWIMLALWPVVTFDDGSSAARTGLYHRAPRAWEREMATRAHMRVADADDPVLCEESIFQILEGRPLWFEPFIMTQLAKEGHWDESTFVEQLRAAHFSLLVLSKDIRNEDDYFPSFTPAMRAAIREAYEFEQVIGGRYWVFVPRGKSTLKTDGVIVEKSVDAQKQGNGRHWDFSPLPVPDIAERNDPIGWIIG